MAIHDKKNGSKTVTGKDGRIKGNIGGGKVKTPKTVPKVKKVAIKTKPKVAVQSPEEILQAFRKAKMEVLAKDIATKAAEAFEKKRLADIQDNIYVKMQEDTDIVEAFLVSAIEEDSISNYVVKKATDGSRQAVSYDIDPIVRPSRYLENDNDDERDAIYLEGHEPLIYHAGVTPVGFLKGDDQDRIILGLGKDFQEKYEAWVMPEHRGKGLELVAINNAIAKKFAAKNFVKPTSAKFEAIVWDGNEAMALDLLREEWELIMPSKEDLLKEDNQRFHLFSKVFTTANDTAISTKSA